MGVLTLFLAACARESVVPVQPPVPVCEGEPGVLLVRTVRPVLPTKAFSDAEPLFQADPRYPQRFARAGLDRWFRVRFPAEIPLTEARARLLESGEVECVSPEVTVSFPAPRAVAASLPAIPSVLPFDDPFLPRQWSLVNDGNVRESVAGADINILDAWKVTTGRPEVVVCIVDGGIDTTHPDLEAALWTNPGEIPDNGLDDDGNGYVDDIHGYNFCASSGAVVPDADSHGTHVAGLVGARSNNGVGIAGVAGADGSPDSGCRLMSAQWYQAKNLMSGQAAALVYGADNGAVISQNSWGFLSRSMTQVPEYIRDAIDYFIDNAGCDDAGNQRPDAPMKGGVVVFSACTEGVVYQNFPSSYERVVSVTACDAAWHKASYSNYNDWTDICAPGGEYAGDEYYDGMIISTAAEGSYYWMMGTSMAAPLVSGTAALVVSAWGGPGFTADMCKSRLLSALRPVDIDQLNPAYAGKLGVGYLDASLAVCAAQDRPAPSTVAAVDIVPYITSARWSFKTVADGQGTAPAYEISLSLQPPRDGVFPDLQARVTRQATRGAAPGEDLSGMFDDLAPDTDYYLTVVATGVTGLPSAACTTPFHTLENHAPVLSGLPAGPVSVCSHTPASLTLSCSDPDGHAVRFSVSGASASGKSSAEGQVVLTLDASGPEGEREAVIVLTDALGLSSTWRLPWKAHTYRAPTLTGQPGGRLLASGQDDHLPLEGLFSACEPLSYTVSATDGVHASIYDNNLTLIGLSVGAAEVTLRAADPYGASAETAFRAQVVEDMDELLYACYPIPCTDVLNLLVNPGAETVSVTLYSATGARALQGSWTPKGAYFHVLDVSGLAPGRYTLELTSGSSRRSLPVLKR